MSAMKIPKNEPRSEAQLREHYLIEKGLANRLKHSSKKERIEQRLYLALYDELFRRVPHHPQLTAKVAPEEQRLKIARQLNILAKFLKPGQVFLELGPGDCELSLQVCRQAKKVFAVDVSREITRHLQPPDNFQLILSDGASIDLPPASVDLAYSNQLMEHCHPDDAVDQLQNLNRCLVPGGKYICITPHLFNGPHDISRYFDREATGFHLKEYTNGELYRLFKAAGFSTIQAYVGTKGRYVLLPVIFIIWFEFLLRLLPWGWRARLSSMFPIKNLLGILLVATKSRKVRASTGS